MSKILKSVHFESDQRVPVETARFRPAPAPAPAPGEAGLIEPAEDGADSAALLDEAQAHVETMLSQAQVQVATWQEEARQEGWQAGYTEAQEAAETELAEALTSVRAAAQAAVEARQKFLRDSQVEIGRLAVAVAQKIIGKELTVNPSAVTDIVAQVIAGANMHASCRIRVNPADYEILKPHWDAIAPLQKTDRTWELVADQRISRGGCLIDAQSGDGTIDARLETQLQQIQSAFEKTSPS